MPSIQRPLSGDVMVFGLAEECERLADPSIVDRSGRSARTLLKSGALRVTLIVLGAGGAIAEHQAAGPITIQPLEGRLRFTALGHEYDVGPGELLSAGPGIRHSVASEDGATFLLTVALPVPERGADEAA